MRALVVTLAVAVLVAPLVASAADGEPRKALTKQGQAIARSVLLRRADLGSGFAPVPRQKNQHLPKGARCGPLDESDLTVTGDAASPDFRFAANAAFVTVGSTAQVYRTLREANASWGRGTSAQTARCLADIVRLSAAAGEKISVVSAKRVPFPALSPKAVAYRLVLDVTLRGTQRVRAFVDAVILQHGRVQTGVLFTSFGRPVRDTDRVALASVVAARMAKAAKAAKAAPSGGPIA